ncbi:AraC family transcriptional regulator [Pectinatus sottacetonis]|uniref:AraC family transcriptional regulator n=1 Tax=Pectinatus sottacetonis TaxID=1002795 RepID=UPI0018C6AC62|nr:AraC family transcriptional regulator [Pectinatus sottacetonis]
MEQEKSNKNYSTNNFAFPIELHYVDFHHPNFTMPFHWHGEYEILYLLKGKFLFSLNEDKLEVSAGDIIFIHDDVIHGGIPQSDDCIYEYIVFDMKKLLNHNIKYYDLIIDILNHKLHINNYFNSQKTSIQKIIKPLFNALREKPPGYEFITLGMLYMFMGTILKNKLYHPANNYAIAISRHHIYQIKQAFQLIEQAYDTPITLRDLAKAAGFSTNYFCKFFQKMTNHTPIDYLNYYRIDRACLKLISSNTSIKQIALSCGFNDLSYFIKTFKKYRGMSPRKYQKSCNIKKLVQ